MIYVIQMIVLYTLNLYSAVHQLYFNKTERKIYIVSYSKVKKYIYTHIYIYISNTVTPVE